MFCTDMTSVQQDYVEQRDKCREYAQLKSDSAGDTPSEKRLVAAFSECMGKNGWTVPSGQEGETKPGNMPGFPPVQTSPTAKGVAAPAVMATAPTPATPAPSADAQSYLKRASECAFARHSSAVSSNAAARAKACDIECAQRLKAMPEAPRPAACPAESTPDITPNMDKRSTPK